MITLINFSHQIYHLVKHLGCNQARSQVDNTVLAAVLGPAMTLKEERGVASTEEKSTCMVQYGPL